MNATPVLDVDFQSVFEAAPGLYLILATDLTIIAVNDAYCRATMTNREDIVGRGLFEVFPDNPDDLAATGVNNLRSSLNRVLTLRRPDAMAVQKYDIRRPDSEGGGFEERYWSPLNLPVIGPSGEVTCIIHRVEDVTQLVRLRVEGEARDQLARDQQLVIDHLRAANEQLAQHTAENKRLDSERRKATKAQRSSWEMLNKTLQSMADPVLIADAKGAIIHSNLAAERLFGSIADLAALKSKNQLYRADGKTVIANEDGPLTRALRGETVSSFEFIWRPNDSGSAVHFIASSQPLRNEDGTSAGAAVVYHDVTAMRAAEARLRQAQKMDAIGQLTGGIAHDFNNMLTVILSNATELVDALDDKPDARSLAEMTKTAAERCEELTHSLLAFARRQPLDPRVVNIGKLVSGMDALLRRTLGEDIDIAFAQSADLWQAMVDASQLESALLNLCLNARDAMPDGGRLTVETANTAIDESYSELHDEVAPGEYVMLCVSDTGTGMTPEVIARAFEPFFSTKPVGKGTGLGLAMVYGFVKQSGGHIKIYSEVGHGTSIKIYLPRARESVVPSAAGPKRKPSDPKGTETILLVEDNDLVRQHGERLLNELGYHVLVADNGAEAVTVLERGEHIDLLFTDVVMPGGMSGRDLAEKAAVLRPGLKVLFTSGYAESAIVHHGRLEPGLHLLRKPYARRELALKLRQVLDAGHGQRRGKL